MSTDPHPAPVAVPGSFRDPRARVYDDGDHVWRAFTTTGLADHEVVAGTAFFKRAVTEGRIVGTRRKDHPDLLADGWAGAVEHDRIPVITHPFEWTFSMLRDAALLQLALVRDGLAEGITCRDGTPYNVQFVGSRPVFIDVGSFAPTRGDAWPGYRQFCQLYLYPLLVEAHLDVPFAPFLRGSLEGITPEHAARLLRGRARFRPGVLTHVTVQAAAARRYAARPDPTAGVVAGSGTSTRVAAAVAQRLEALIERLPVPASATTWSGYEGRGHYSDRSLAAKDAFVRTALAAARPEVVADLGCNDGRYARLAAERAATVVALDADRRVVDRLYRSLGAGGPAILPLVADLADPSPALGWGLTERAALRDRLAPDLALALALVHHLVIGRNVPIGSYLDDLAATAPHAVLEVPHREDPMVRRLLAAKDADIHADYDLATIRRHVDRRFRVVADEVLPGGTRTILHLRRLG